jgi:hypothetical protein
MGVARPDASEYARFRAGHPRHHLAVLHERYGVEA